MEHPIKMDDLEVPHLGNLSLMFWSSKSYVNPQGVFVPRRDPRGAAPWLRTKDHPRTPPSGLPPNGASPAKTCGLYIEI